MGLQHLFDDAGELSRVGRDYQLVFPDIAFYILRAAALDHLFQDPEPVLPVDLSAFDKGDQLGKLPGGEVGAFILRLFFPEDPRDVLDQPVGRRLGRDAFRNERFVEIRLLFGNKI